MNRLGPVRVSRVASMLIAGVAGVIPCATAWSSTAVVAAVNEEAGAPAETGLQFQDADDPVQRLKPLKPRGVTDEARLDALAWFASGRLMQNRGDAPGALRAYRKAIESDPTSLAVYREAIRLAVELKQLDSAADWAKKAVELDPANLQMLMQAVSLLKSREDLSGAIQLLEMGVKAPGLDHNSPPYVLLVVDLAILHAVAERKTEAAAGFEVLFDALSNPEKYKLDPKTRSQLQSNPATSYERMGQIFLDVGKTDLALASFRKAAESKKGPAAGNLSFHLAQVYLKAGQPEQALDEIQKYIDSQRQSKQRAAYELLVQILEKLGKSQELIPRLQEAAGKDPRNSTLSYFLAEQYSLANRLDEAEALFKSTLDSAAEAQGYIGLASVYRRRGRPAELLDTLAKGYTEAGELKGTAAEFKAILGDEKLLSGLMDLGVKRLDEQPPSLDFASGYVLANLAADAKRSEIAQRLYRHLLTLRKERAKDIYEELGNHLSDVRKYAEAAAVYEEATNDPVLGDVRPHFLFMLAHALALSGETTKALEAIAAAQQLIPNNPLLRSEEAWIYFHGQQFDEAVKRFEKLIADFPQPQAQPIIRRAQFMLSNIHVVQGDVKKGMAILEAIYRDNPNDIQVNNDLGYLYADNGMNLEQAEGMIRKALTAEPQNAAFLDSMGWVLFKLGRYDEAVPFLEKAVKISTGSGDETLYDHLGDVYDRLQQGSKAVEAWQKSLELARAAVQPDKKLIERVEEKLKNRKQENGKLKPARPDTP